MPNTANKFAKINLLVVKYVVDFVFNVGYVTINVKSTTI